MELLVAMAITLIVIAVSMSALDEFQRTSEEITLSAGTLENLRAGMNYISRDLVLTGQGIPTGGIAIPNGAGVPINRPGPPALTFPLAYTAVPAITPGASLGVNILRPSDILSIMYADNTIPLNQNLINDPNPPAANPPIQPCAGAIDPAGATVTFDPNCINISNGTINIRPGDLIMLSNAQGNTLQTVTSVAGQVLNFAAGDPFNLNQRNDPGGTIQQLQSPPGSGNYPPTTATRVIMVTYFLDNAIPNDPRLMRQINFNAPQAVAENIEDLQVSYDYIDGLANPTNQKFPPAGDSPNQTESANLFLAARSTQPFSSTRQFFRSNLATQVSLRGMAYFNRFN